MSCFGVNEYDMSRNRFSDQDIERLLAGGTPEDSALAVLVPMVDQLHTQWDRHPAPDRVSAFARSAAWLSLSPPTTVAAAEAPEIPKPHRRRRLTPRLAVPLAFVVLLSGLTGAAIAAEGAVPGDPLYGLNLALEKVGIGGGGVDKRLAEAAELASRGDDVGALEHAAAAISSEEPDAEGTALALSGLEQAIDQLTSEVPGQSNEVRSRVAEMLQWMIDNAGLIHDPESEPGAFGRGVAAMARQIGGKQSAPDDDSSQESEITDEGNKGVLGEPAKGSPGPPTEGIPPNRP